LPGRPGRCHARRVAGFQAGLKRVTVAVLAVAVVSALPVVGAGLAPAGASARAAPVLVDWGVAVEVPGTAALNAGGDAQVLSLSCWRPEACAAGGFYTDAAGHEQAFVVTAAAGLWGDAAEVPGTARLNAGGSAQVLSVSCARDGGCAAGGFYTDAAGHQQAFVVSLAGGVWGRAVELTGTGKLNAGGSARVIALSCPAARGCAAVGDYRRYRRGVGAQQGFVASEHDGRWAAAVRVPGLAGLPGSGRDNAAATALSCPSAGNCAVGGWWARGSSQYGFVLSQAGGRWARLVALRGGGAVTSVSCARAGDCLAGGTHNPPSSGPDGYVVTETRSRWSGARYLAVLAGDTVSAVSCPSPGNCAVAGVGPGVDAPSNAYAMNERSGRWPAAVFWQHWGGVVGTGDLVELSCSSAGNCGIAGAFQQTASANGIFNFNMPFQDAEVGRDWDTSGIPWSNKLIDFYDGPSQASSVSCWTADACVAGGYYTTCPMPNGYPCLLSSGQNAPDTTVQAWIEEPGLDRN
jgi:hypothetical protein